MGQELPKVRLALPEDDEPLLEMCRRLHQENGLFAFSDRKVMELIKNATTRNPEALTAIGVIGPPDKLEGSICISITEFYYTEELHVTELWNFVDAPYRASNNAAALIEFGRSSARAANLPFFTGIITNKQMAGKVRLYRKIMGRPPVGAFFLDNSDWAFDPISDHHDLVVELKELCRRATTPPPRGEYPYKDMRRDYAAFRGDAALLLRKAVQAVDQEDNVWAPPKKSSNGAAAEG